VLATALSDFSVHETTETTSAINAPMANKMSVNFAFIYRLFRFVLRGGVILAMWYNAT
jgi:hypothetical protein